MDSKNSSDESSELTTLILCLVCHDADLKKDYDFISNEVLPRIWLNCFSQKVKLFISRYCLKENLVKEVVDDFRSHYVNSAKPRNYISFILNLTSELQVETTQISVGAKNNFSEEYGSREASAQSLFLLFRNVCSACFPGRCSNSCTSLFKQNGQDCLESNQVLILERQCLYCEGVNSSETQTNVTFCQKVLDFLQDHIIAKLTAIGHFQAISTNERLIQQSALQAALISHATMNSNSSVWQDTLDTIIAFIDDTDVQVPLILLGEMGTSKTAIMAAAVMRTIERHLSSEQQHGTQFTLFYHFAGLVPNSAELDVFLSRLVRELNLVENSAHPVDICAAVQLCNSTLSNLSGPPVVIFVDSIDLLDDIVSGQKLKWIPSSLAPRVRLILSATTGSHQHLSLKARTNPPCEVTVPTLSVSSRVRLAESIIRDGFPLLSSDLGSVLANISAASSPLWLSAACCLLHLDVRTATCSPNALSQVQKKAETMSQNLEGLWEDILCHLERLSCCDLLTRTLSLITSSAAGLRKSELRDLLILEPLRPPSPFEEKAEAEVLEKAMPDVRLVAPCLPLNLLEQVLEELKPCLLQLSDGVEGRFYIRHDTLKKTIRNRYFVCSDVGFVSNDESDSLDMSYFWHGKLAHYFQTLPDSHRKFEECLYQVCQLEDVDGLADFLSQWPVFDHLFTDEYSTILLGYWKKASGTDEMICRYKAALAKLEAEMVDYNTLAMRHEHVARLFILSGKYAEALELAKLALKWEEMELGKRPERMVEVYGLLTDIYDEKLKLQDFISPSQITDLRKTISYGRKSIDLRSQLTSRYHKFKLGISLMKLAFSLESWAGCGGDATLATSAALTEGQGHANKAIEIFKELNDQGHYAEALMTKGVLSPRGTNEQLQFYQEALDICLEVNGENHILTSRIYINIGIVHEDNKEYVKAYKYFAKWAKVNEIVLGSVHPKTMRAKRVLKEPRYLYIASRLKDLEQPRVEEGDRENILTEDMINEKAKQIDESVQARSDDGNSEDDESQDAEEPDILDMMRPGRGTLFNLASELRRMIEEMLQHAMRDSEDDDLRNLFTDIRVAEGLGRLNVLCSDLSLDEDDDSDDDNNDDNEGGTNETSNS